MAEYRNPEFEEAPYEEVFLKQDGTRVPNMFPRRYKTEEDALAHRNQVPKFIVEEVKTKSLPEHSILNRNYKWPSGMGETIRKV